ncbi:MAG: hypothetical protein FD177_241 [Desulfovibrionaceae bacterium]|nr:MAG: hypothetical protein FD177_241 [Desulfovibrionaceae bacterium]
MNVMILGIRRKTRDAKGQDEGERTKPERFSVPVISNLGMELVDIVNVLRGLNTPEERILQAVITRAEC